MNGNRVTNKKKERTNYYKEVVVSNKFAGYRNEKRESNIYSNEKNKQGCLI